MGRIQPQENETANPTGFSPAPENTGQLDSGPPALPVEEPAILKNDPAVSPPDQTGVSESTEKVGESEEPLVTAADEFLKGIFKKHFHNAMVEAGNYIIATFYGGDATKALIKNKSEDQPQSINKLIKRLREDSKTPEGNVHQQPGSTMRSIWRHTKPFVGRWDSKRLESWVIATNCNCCTSQN